MGKKAKDFSIAALGAAIILGVYFACDFALECAGSSISPSLTSMVVLFLLLWAKIIPLWAVEKTAELLLKNMVFFFVPILAVLPMTYDSFKDHIWAIILALTISVALTISATGVCLEALAKFKNKQPHSGDIKK